MEHRLYNVVNGLLFSFIMSAILRSIACLSSNELTHSHTHTHTHTHITLATDVVNQLENVTSTALNGVGDITEAIRVVSWVLLCKKYCVFSTVIVACLALSTFTCAKVHIGVYSHLS